MRARTTEYKPNTFPNSHRLDVSIARSKNFLEA